jgi:hypothetical protein
MGTSNLHDVKEKNDWHAVLLEVDGHGHICLVVG